MGFLKEYINYFAIIVALDAISAIVFAKLRQQERLLVLYLLNF